MEDNRIQGEADDIKQRMNKKINNPQGMGYRPKGHRKQMHGTGGTVSARHQGRKKHRGKRGGK